MKTIIKLIDLKNRDNDDNSKVLNIDLSGIQFIPRIGENVCFNSQNYFVKEIQHSFEEESEYEIEQTIMIHLNE
jgi:hypothetical protein